uniref:DDE_Tnp_IS1595 domain-containing protein n=1 Tax=Caenorhabditis tropicalis TaxID=1561998 RepID=A0A1I7U8K1_9PELO
MDSDGLEGFDFTQPLTYALSQLHGETEFMEEEEEFRYGEFPKPSSLSAMATQEDSEDPPTTAEIIDEIVNNLNDYPKTVRILMQRGLLKKRQICKKCERNMTLRRRKNLYEWRCRTKDKRGDCSSCSIKTGSWFEYTKIPFPTLFNFLIMHCKKCSIQHMANKLNLSSHTINDVRRYVYQITDRIKSKQMKIGQNNKEVYVEVIGIKPKTTVSGVIRVVAGIELTSNCCFAEVLPDSSSATLERIKYENIAPGAKVTMIKTVFDDSSSAQNAEFFDEVSFFSDPSDRFFTNIRRDPTEYVFSNQLFQSWLNDEVVRKEVGNRLLEKCIEELITYTQ